MKVLFWTDGFWPRMGGIETQGLKFIENMQQRGHEYIVLAQKDHPDWKEEETYRGISIRRYNFSEIIEKKELGMIRSLHDYLESVMREFQPDIIHLNAYIGWCAIIFLFLRSVFRAPIVLTVHAPVLYGGRLSSFSMRITSMADQVCCVSNWVLQEMQKHLPTFGNKLRLIYNGLTMPVLTPSPICFSPATLLLLGRLSPEKGFDTAIRAFSLLKKGGSDVQLLIAGEGAERQSLEKLVHELGLKDSVQFTGEVAMDEVPALINQATLVIVPSSFESFGLVALEAMQMGRPVIASNVGGLREIVSNGETGLLVPSQDPIALCQAIQSLLEQPEKAIRMGEQGRARAMEKFTLHQNVTQYEALYKDLMQVPERRGDLA